MGELPGSDHQQDIIIVMKIYVNAIICIAEKRFNCNISTNCRFSNEFKRKLLLADVTLRVSGPIVHGAMGCCQKSFKLVW